MELCLKSYENFPINDVIIFLIFCLEKMYFKLIAFWVLLKKAYNFYI